MTPREFAREREAASKIWARERRRDILLAWETANYVGGAMVGKLPPLQPILDRVGSGARRRQSLEDMKAQIEILSQMSGFPMQFPKGKES